MQHLWETILGLNKGFLAGEGRFSLRFHPSFPGQEWIGAGLYNVLLIAASIALVVYVYRQAGGARSWRWAAAGLRLMLFLLLIAALNQPVIHLQQIREQPSVLAVMIDDSQSMQVADQPVAGVEQPRLDAVKYLLTDPASALLANLGRDHELRLYHLDPKPFRWHRQDQLRLIRMKPTEARVIGRRSKILQPNRPARRLRRQSRRFCRICRGRVWPAWCY